MVACVASAAVMAWAVFSFVDANAHNLSDGKIAEWNMFRLATAASTNAKAEQIEKTEEIQTPQQEEAKVETVKAEDPELEAIRAEQKRLEEEQLRQQEEALRQQEEAMEAEKRHELRIEAVKEATMVPGEYVEYAFEIGEQEGISPEFIVADMEFESCGKATAVGRVGEQGLMQLNPKWFKKEMAELGVSDLFDPYTNILVGTRTFKDLFEKYDGEIYQVLMYYNAGQNGLKAARNGNYSDYAKNVVNRTRELEALSE